ncbi:hypothetical protein SLEP1_g26299 [Rubroshorea leprosula]|uniref:Reverse transcriptase/retrotransposon-derived protein RNase H-like domain-containing protein n=1 Tax=Rubroshorea leprosula TaxID=152421 RepID=A0AAV5JV92_9ROSI|nr:hypothetical protein SLEP1_g26299 [Rubroshorea leprosula]
MFSKYHAMLENIGISQFARLLNAARRTAISVKAISIGKSMAKSTEKKTTAHTLALCPWPRTRAECLTLKVGNKILAKHLDSFGEADHLISPEELPTLHEAQPMLTSLESLKAINLGDDLANPKHVHISTTLSIDEKVKMINLLREYKDVFAWNYDKMLGLNPALVAHSLNVDLNMKPVVQPNRAFHPKVTLKIKEEVEKLLAAGFIKPTKKPTWLANIVPIQKKNGQIKCCVDFRDLNKACPKDEFVVPNMDVLMDNMASCEMYSLMDGSSRYNQVSMCLSNVEKIAFRTPIGNFYYVVMSFRLKNAKATYQRVMVAIFHDFIHLYIEIYIDDIVMKSKIRLGHFDVLRKVFNRCRLYKLKMNLVKCAFDVSVRKFLGFLVSKHDISADLANPLLKKGAAFTWIEERQGAFSHLQNLMHKLPTISIPVQGRPLKVYLSTSDKAMSALVAQDDQEGKEQPIYYVSRNLTSVESRYNSSPSLSPSNTGVQYPISYEVSSGEVATTQEIEEEWIPRLKGLGLALFLEMTKAMTWCFHSSLISSAQTTPRSRKLILSALLWLKSQHLKQSFASIRYEQGPRMENRLADALATIASRVFMAKNPFSV